ncbi:V-type ATP synthase subunit I [Alkalibacterium olivapovliticus]|uniref:V/A-type H+-transporting ATPase subunit I n=1 Tax=Alkalibacterium olivapovliticus TaxID=99907 RepID=A0A2T0WAW4_9LACT|nr:V-type ATP synthase subunit I [Alkalibacterium olivapovliticus]PRY83850.1 V/A-type H+-transporting ATPase subunit I [Alkalibacterium olivapovliticus]
MAIAKMKKLTLLAEHANKEALLKSVQEMQSLEIIPLAEDMEDELLKDFETNISNKAASDMDTRLQDIEYSINYLKEYIDQPGLFEKLKSKKEVYSLKDLEKHVEKADIEVILDDVSKMETKINQLDEQIKDLKQEEAFLRKWRALNFMPEEVKGFKLMDVIVGSVDKEHAEELVESLKENGKMYFDEIYRRSDEVAYLIIIPKAEKAHFDQVIGQYSFRALNYKHDLLPEDALYNNLTSQKERREERQSTIETMSKWKDRFKDLELAEEYYYNISERQNAQSLFIDSHHLFLLSGWIEEDKVAGLKKNVERTIGDNEVVILSDDIQMREYADVPIVLKNNNLVRPFEMITKMFSYPKYNDVDPTPLMMPFFMVFFGIMSADLGYGLLLFGVTLFALKALNIEGSTGSFVKFLHILSYPTMAFGVFFGSFFGIELPIQVFSLQDDVLEIMAFSVVLGLIHLLYGLILNGKIKNRQGQRASAYVDGYAWFLMLIGFILWIAGAMLLNNQLLTQVGIGLVVLNAVGILAVSAMSSSNKALGLGLGAYNLYGISGYVGDIVSYTRLMALGVASANIAMAFNMIIGFLPPVARFTVGILIIIALHTLNIALTFLSAYVHTSRLQYVEFFGKFYEGGGKPLTPLKMLEKHIWMEDNNN